MNSVFGRRFALVAMFAVLLGGTPAIVNATDGLNPSRFSIRSNALNNQRITVELRENQQIRTNPLRDSAITARISGAVEHLSKPDAAAISIARIQMPTPSTTTPALPAAPIAVASAAVKLLDLDSRPLEIMPPERNQSLLLDGVQTSTAFVEALWNRATQLTSNLSRISQLEASPSEASIPLVAPAEQPKSRVPASTASWRREVQPKTTPDSPVTSATLKKLSCGNMMTFSFEDEQDLRTQIGTNSGGCFVNDEDPATDVFYPLQFALDYRILIEEYLPLKLDFRASTDESQSIPTSPTIQTGSNSMPVLRATWSRSTVSSCTGSLTALKKVSGRLLSGLKPWLNVCQFVQWQRQLENVLFEIEGVLWGYRLDRIWSGCIFVPDELAIRR